MLQRTYIVSAHGNCNGGNQFLVPVGVKIYFYSAPNTVLQDKTSWGILKSLLNRSDRWKDYVNHTRSSGEWCSTYYCWDYPEIGNGSGIFRRKTGERISLTGTTPIYAYWLNDMIRELKPTSSDITLKIHWLCCTSRYNRTLSDPPVRKKTRVI
ncbi:putative adhesin [Teredinibacter turnerae]|uniref:putative adhesin n=1 Tax=Teredinibacter turnerae TaxID=2426 RepID=UPI000A834701